MTRDELRNKIAQGIVRILSFRIPFRGDVVQGEDRRLLATFNQVLDTSYADYFLDEVNNQLQRKMAAPTPAAHYMVEQHNETYTLSLVLEGKKDIAGWFLDSADATLVCDELNRLYGYTKQEGSP